MMNRFLKNVLVMITVPTLAVTAVVAEETPTAPPTSQSTAPKSAQEKAREDELARLNHAKAVAETEKAIEEAQKGAREARGSGILGPLSDYEGAEGKATIDATERSVLEATLLSSIALQEAADPLGRDLHRIVTNLGSGSGSNGTQDGQTPFEGAIANLSAAERRVCADFESLNSSSSPGPRAIVIVAEDNRGPVSLAETFTVRSSRMARELCLALTAAQEATGRTAELQARLPGRIELRGGALPIAAIGGVVNTAANLLRTDYTVYGIALEEDQDLFVRELARAFLATGATNPVYAPGLFPLGQSDAENPALRRIEMLDRLHAAAVEAAALQARRSRFFEQRLASAGDLTEQVRAAKEVHDTAKQRLEAAAKAYEDMMRTLSAEEGNNPPALVAVIRQAHAAELLRQGGLLVVTNVHFMGGTSYTRQNFFSGLFGMPYRVSGGVLVSYIVHDGRDGRVYAARAVPVSGGFYRPTEIRAAIAQRRR